MGILSWIVLGLIAGWLTTFIMPVGKLGLIKTMVLGIAGALIGGYISTLLGWGNVSGFNITSIIISVLGAVLLIYVFRLVTKK